jgi:hypothetical protein
MVTIEIAHPTISRPMSDEWFIRLLGFGGLPLGGGSTRTSPAFRRRTRRVEAAFSFRK